MPNPFTNRTMITDPNRFFGRTRELEAIFSRLEPDQPQNVSVIGDNRIGRSSLLEHIRQTYPTRLRKSERYRVGYLEALGARGSSDIFRARALGALGIAEAETMSAVPFEAALIGVRESGQTPILLLDELESLTEFPDKFNDEFFDWARSVLNRGLLTLVTTSVQTLPEIASQRKFLSTFFGLFTQVELGDFTETEAQAYLQQPSDRPLHETHVRFVLALVGRRHPCKPPAARPRGPFEGLGKLAIAADHVYQHYGDGGWNEAQAAAARKGYEHDVRIAWSTAPRPRPCEWTRHADGSVIG